MAHIYEGDMSRNEHPAGRTLTTVSVSWFGQTAALEVVNRRGSIVELVVSGTAKGNRRIRVAGNDHIAVMYDVPAGERLCVLVDDDSRRILYDGACNDEEFGNGW